MGNGGGVVCVGDFICDIDGDKAYGVCILGFGLVLDGCPMIW